MSDMMKEVFTRHSCLQVSPNAIVSPHVSVNALSSVIIWY